MRLCCRTAVRLILKSDFRLGLDQEKKKNKARDPAQAAPNQAVSARASGLAMEAQSYAVNEQGERVIAASRRPDGTLRKERRVKPGYVPQDEQPVYQPRGAVVRGQPGLVAVVRVMFSYTRRLSAGLKVPCRH